MIQRYDHVNIDGDSEMLGTRRGEYVLYDDHVAAMADALAAKDEMIAGLEAIVNSRATDMAKSTISARTAARHRLPLGVADVQALEHAITITERERDEYKARIAELESRLPVVHDLRVDPEDLPPHKTSTRALVWVWVARDDLIYGAIGWHGVKAWHFNGEGVVIAWQELPLWEAEK